MKICALHFSDASFTEPEKLADDAKPSLFTKNAVALRTTELYVLQLILSSSIFFATQIETKFGIYLQ